MIRAIGNTPAPAPIPAPVPEPADGGNEGKQLAFKGIILKNVPSKTPLTEYFDYIYSAKPVKSLRNGISRHDLAERSENTFLFHLGDNLHLMRGKTKALEEQAYNDLVKNKEKISGIEVHLVDDWV